MKVHDAFDAILDKLLDATAKSARDDGALIEARSATTRAQQAIETLQRQVAVLKEDSAKAAPIISELFKAATELNKVCGHFSDRAGFEMTLGAERSRLEKALAAATEACDILPF